jgi:C1A family cysteine protease
MKYKKIMLLVCMVMCILLGISGAFANELDMNETISEADLDSQQLQIDCNDSVITSEDSNDLSAGSEVYFDASATSDGDGSKANPYKEYKAERIDYGTTAYFADGVYDIKEPISILGDTVTFIGQSKDKTILRFNLANKFDFTVNPTAYFVLKDLTLKNVHIDNQANLIANNVVFRDGVGFSINNQPGLSYSNINKRYNSTCGGVIVCDTPSGTTTTINLMDCSFINNAATSGGIIAAHDSTVNIRNCVFYNSSASRFGGVIYSESSNINIYDSYFEHSHAKYGGVVYADSSDILIEDSIFNSSQSFSFGGVIASTSTKLDVNHVQFVNYTALDDAGGAIYAVTGELNVEDSSFKDGHSDFGGAICNLRTDSKILNSEFLNNDAVYFGGSIYNMYGNIIINNNRFANTHANRSGGSIFNRISDSFELLNNEFVNSAADAGHFIFIDGGKVNVVQRGNVYDTSYVFIEYGNIYDIEYYQSVPLLDYSAEVPDVLPSSYDGRKYNYITPAKDQVQGGNCWAFAGISTLEACLKKATGVEYDFSEENVKNLMSEYSLFGSGNEINTGGNLYMFIAYLAGWFGPTYDEFDRYDDYSSLSVIYDSIIHVQNVYILPERQSVFDNDYIKRAVMEYGAVSIGIDLPGGQGHAVTIVGWDDEFSSNDFLDNKAVGAWIIKNSWGTNWGYEGFEYLSYQQPISFGYTFIFDDSRGYSDVYQYDFSGKSGFHSINAPEAYLKNKFTAKNDEILSAFSTYFDEPTNYTASVYLNGKLVTRQSGFSDTGYYTIPFDNEVSLSKGDEFEVEVKFVNGAPVYIPICTASEINMMTFDKGISFYSGDGKNWQDLYNSYHGVACIKAFTRLNELSEVSIDDDQFSGDSNPFGKVNTGDPISIKLAVPQYYVVDGVKHPLEGIVTFTINNESYYASVEDGIACLNVTFEDAGLYEVSAQYKSNRMISNFVNFTVNVVKTNLDDIGLEVKDVSKFYGGPEKYVATLTELGKVLSGVNVKVSVGGKNYTVKTNDKGQVILDLQDLSVGVYDVYTQYLGKVVASKFTVLTTINVNDLTRDFLDSYISASFVNTDGNALVNKEVSFKIANREFNATTDKAGLATANARIYAGTYTVKVSNPVNGEQKEFALEILQIDSQCSISITQLGKVVTISATVNPAQATGYVNFLLLGNVYKADVVKGTATVKFDNLAIGNYNVTAIYSSDVNLRVSSDTKSFSVTDNPYQLSSGNYWSYCGAAGTMAKITDEKGNPVQGEVVYATVLNTTYNATTDKDGNAIFRMNLDAGNYSVTFKYKGQSVLYTMFVYSTISMDDSSGEYLNSTIVAHFNSPYSNMNSSGVEVKFLVDGKEYSAITDSNGYARATVDDLEAGTHDVTIINSLSGEKKQSSITVYKTTPTITLKKTQRKSTLILTASLEQASAIGNIVFTMGSDKYTCRVIDGKATLAFNDFKEGSYEAYANYVGDANFNNILSATMDFDFVPSDYELSVPPQVSKYYGGLETVNANLTNYDKPVSGAVVSVLMGGKTYNIRTNSNGIASFGPKLDPGDYVLKFTYDDLDISSELVVKSTISTVGASDVSTSKASAIIYDSHGDEAINKRVTFKIASKEYYATTDENGIATIDFDDYNLELGDHNVEIINPITGESITSKITITKAIPNLSLALIKDKGVDALKATLPKDATGTVNFVLNDGLSKSVYESEVVNGVAILPDVDSGDFNVNATYSGDDHYKTVSKSIKIHVDSILITRMITSKVTTTYGTGKNLEVILIDEEDNPVSGKTIRVKLNNVFYSGVTNSAGKAIILIPASLPVKTYTATVTFDGDRAYGESSSTVSVVVNKATPKLTAAKKTFKVSVKTKKYIVTLKTDKNKVYKNQKVTLKVKGKTYTARTNSKGKATFKITKLTKKGKFTATVKFAGNAGYKAVTKKVKITVKK